MPSLCSRRASVMPGVPFSTTKLLIAARPRVGIERGPHHDGVAALAGGDEDLLAVEHVVVAVLARRRADRGRVAARVGLGDRHRRPLAREALRAAPRWRPRRWPRCPDPGAECVSAKPTSPQHSSVEAEHGRHVGAVADAGMCARTRVRCLSLPAPALIDASPSFMPSSTAASMSSSLGYVVLGQVVLARNRPKHLVRHQVCLIDQCLQLLRNLEIHGKCTCQRSMKRLTPARRLPSARWRAGRGTSARPDAPW